MCLFGRTLDCFCDDPLHERKTTMSLVRHQFFGIARLAVLALAVAIIFPSVAHAQRGGHGGHGAGQAAFGNHHRNRYGGIWGGYWYPDYYNGYGYGYGFPGGGFGPWFVDPYGVFGGASLPRGSVDPYGVYGGPSIFNRFW
jgi:hypothetical protein